MLRFSTFYDFLNLPMFVYISWTQNWQNGNITSRFFDLLTCCRLPSVGPKSIQNGPGGSHEYPKPPNKKTDHYKYKKNPIELPTIAYYCLLSRLRGQP